MADSVTVFSGVLFTLTEDDQWFQAEHEFIPAGGLTPSDFHVYPNKASIVQPTPPVWDRQCGLSIFANAD